MKTTFVVLVGFFVLAVFVAAWLRTRETKGSSDNRWPFVPRKPLSAPEQVLFFRLQEALPEHIVLAQVQLSRFLAVKRGHPVQAWLNRINRKSVDFLILAKDATVVAAIELDDRSHERADRRHADAQKNRALADAGVRLIRWGVSRMPDATMIRAEFAKPQTEMRSASRDGRIEPVLASRAA